MSDNNVTVSKSVFKRMAEGMTNESYAQLLIDLEDSSNEAMRFKQLLIDLSNRGKPGPMVESDPGKS